MQLNSYSQFVFIYNLTLLSSEASPWESWPPRRVDRCPLPGHPHVPFLPVWLWTTYRAHYQGISHWKLKVNFLCKVFLIEVILFIRSLFVWLLHQILTFSFLPKWFSPGMIRNPNLIGLSGFGLVILFSWCRTRVNILV